MIKRILFILFVLAAFNTSAQVPASSHDADIDSMFAANAKADSILKANLARDTYIDVVVLDVTGEVNDWEDIIGKENESLLVKMIKAHEKKTTDEIAIVTTNDIGPFGTDLDDYSLRLANKVGVGKKDKNNGVTIVISQKLRKMRIDTGLGIGEKLSDAECKRIIDDIMIPEFKKDDYEAGITKGLAEIIRLLEQ